MAQTICIDARMLGFTGIGTYLLNLVEGIASIDNEFQFDVLCTKQCSLRGLLPVKFRFVPATAPIYGVREQCEIPWLARGADLMHCPHYNVPRFYRGQFVVTIHDLTHLIHREFLPNRGAFLYARFMLKSAARRATRIITVSNYSKASIQEHFHLPGDKIRVIHNALPVACSPSETIPNRTRLREMGIHFPYLLFVGLLKPHKNVQGLIQAYASMAPELRDAYQLVIAGAKTDFYAQLRRSITRLHLTQRVVFTGYVSDSDLQTLYSGATLFVLPSFNEGFGLPVLEAMAHGLPVVVSNTSSLPEVAGRAGVLVDPNDLRAMATVIQQILLDEPLRQRLARLSRERARCFSTREFALQHLKVYREALNSETSHPASISTSPAWR